MGFCQHSSRLKPPHCEGERFGMVWCTIIITTMITIVITIIAIITIMDNRIIEGSGSLKPSTALAAVPRELCCPWRAKSLCDLLRVYEE